MTVKTKSNDSEQDNALRRVAQREEEEQNGVFQIKNLGSNAVAWRDVKFWRKLVEKRFPQKAWEPIEKNSL